MKLIIGGYSQGKLNYIRQERNMASDIILDGRLPDKKQRREIKAQGKTVIINHFHDWVRKQIAQGECPEEEIQILMEENLELVIICDEIGNGIVPMDAFEREYRERTGRILVQLAGQADEVVRVICGIGQKIK